MKLQPVRGLDFHCPELNHLNCTDWVYKVELYAEHVGLGHALLAVPGKTVRGQLVKDDDSKTLLTYMKVHVSPALRAVVRQYTTAHELFTAVQCMFGTTSQPGRASALLAKLVETGQADRETVAQYWARMMLLADHYTAADGRRQLFSAPCT